MFEIYAYSLNFYIMLNKTIYFFIYKIIREWIVDRVDYNLNYVVLPSLFKNFKFKAHYYIVKQVEKKRMNKKNN